MDPKHWDMDQIADYVANLPDGRQTTMKHSVHKFDIPELDRLLSRCIIDNDPEGVVFYEVAIQLRKIINVGVVS